MGDYAHFSRDPSLWEGSTQMPWGSHDICPSLSQFQVEEVTQSELSDTTPRRPTSVALGTPPSIRGGDPCGPERPVLAVPKPVATSQLVSPQADMLDGTVSSSHSSTATLVLETPEVVSVPTTPSCKRPTGIDMGSLSDEVLWLQGEMNRAMGWLLSIRASIDTCHRKLVSHMETTFHQNEAQTTKPLGRWRPIVQPQFKTLRLHTQQPSGRQRPIAWLQFKMLRLCVQQLSGRWRLPLQIAPAPCNNCTVTLCRA